MRIYTDNLHYIEMTWFWSITGVRVKKNKNKNQKTKQKKKKTEQSEWVLFVYK